MPGAEVQAGSDHRRGARWHGGRPGGDPARSPGDAVAGRQQFHTFRDGQTYARIFDLERAVVAHADPDGHLVVEEVSGLFVPVRNNFV